MNRVLEMNKLGAGIKLKINVVVMRGINEQEIIKFVDLGRYNDLEVRFIEYMPFDGNKWSKQKLFTKQEIINVIESKYEINKTPFNTGDTAQVWQIPGFKGKFGVISSMTDNFCSSCTRSIQKIRINEKFMITKCIRESA